MSEKEEKSTKSFNIYYLNFSKVYEIAMMINNVIISNIQRENSKSSERSKSRKASLTGGIVSMEYLAEVKAGISTEVGSKDTSSSKMVESLEVKTTKSILLRKIIDKAKNIKDFSESKEGDLIKIDSIKLKILNEENLRQLMMLRKDALKGLRVEGMEVSNLLGSMLQDYSYILHGKMEDGRDLVIKIPFEIENEFENKYNVDDLIIGNVSIIGVYKGIVTESFISANTFNYLSSLGAEQNNSNNDAKVIPSVLDNEPKKQPQKSKVEKDYNFIDIISIIQDIAFEEIKKEPVETSFFKKILSSLKSFLFN